VKSTFWKSTWFLGLLLTTLFLTPIVKDSSLLQSIEFSLYDAAVSSSAELASDRVVILDIDDESIELIGRWPWPRTVMADMPL
jgi:CHASE2 domain-containing sensor protein